MHYMESLVLSVCDESLRCASVHQSLNGRTSPSNSELRFLGQNLWCLP